MNPLPTVEEITSLYLYGTISPPENKIHDVEIRNKDFILEWDISVNDYMTGPGRFAAAHKFEIIEKFLNPFLYSNSSILDARAYSKEELYDAFGIDDIKRKILNINQYLYDDDIDDYIERAYIWNTTAFMIKDGVEFVVEANGNRYIRNLAIIPYDGGTAPENFDFIAGDLLGQALNQYLKPKIDPSGIGRTVNFLFSGEPPLIQYGYADYVAEIAVTTSPNPLAVLQLATERVSLLNRLYESDITKFLDENGRAILYGSNNDDYLSRYNFDASIFSVDSRLTTAFDDVGAVMIGGQGDDTLIGSVHNDLLFGGVGSDYLLGGVGFDTYAFSSNNGADFINDKDGIGNIEILGTVIQGAGPEQYYRLGSKSIWNIGSDQLIYSYDRQKKRLEISGEIVGNNNIITVSNYDIDRVDGYLGIELIEEVNTALVSASHSNPFLSSETNIGEQFDTLQELGSLFLRWYSSVGAKDGDAVTFEVLNGDGSLLKIDVYSQRYSLELPVTINLQSGQNEIPFLIVNDQIINSNQSIELVVKYSRNGEEIQSNIFTLNITDGEEVVNSFFGDQRAMIQTNATTGEQYYDWSSTTWNINGTLDGGTEEVNFDDVIYATDHNDSVDGKGGNDALNGGLGDDKIDGGGGDDLIAAGSGSDTVYGGAGNDLILSASNLIGVPQRTGPADMWTPPAGDSVYIQGSNWGVSIPPDYFLSVPATTLTVHDVDGDVIDAGEGDDYIFASHGNDQIKGGSGSDFIDGYGGNDVLDGGEERDIIFGDGDWEQVFSGLNRTPLELHGVDFIDGGGGNDQLSGEGKGDVLFGGAGNDLIIGDSFENAGLPDEYLGDDYLDGQDGDDVLFGNGRNDTLYGGSGNDDLLGDDRFSQQTFHGSDYLDGQGGNDILTGGGSADHLIGGSGNDTVFGDDIDIYVSGEFHGVDVLDGGAGADYLFGGGDSDTLYGGEEGDQLHGDDVESELAGEFHGDDFLDGEEGDDSLFGGGGSDTLLGSDGADQLQGDEDESALAGEFHGNDFLDGAEGADTVFGQSGSDALFGGAGDDLLLGDARESTNSGQYHGNDFLDGEEGNDFVEGNGGDDRVFGGFGNDTLYGDTPDVLNAAQVNGNDLLNGNEGNDVLVGGAGDDTLIGGEGGDFLDGGEGDDTFEAGIGDLVSDQRGINSLLLVDGGPTALVASGLDLVLNYGSSGNLLVEGGLSGSLGFVEGITTSQWLQSHLLERIENSSSASGQILYGGSNHDTLTALHGNSTLNGGNGNDELIGSDENDVLIGGSGINNLNSGYGNDVLVSTGELDYLDGGYGDDLFQISSTTGTVRIINAIREGEDGDSDNIQLSGSAETTVIKVSNNGIDLMLAVFTESIDSEGQPVLTAGPSISIVGYFDPLLYEGATSTLDEIRFEDGSSISIQELLEQSVTGTDEGDVLYGLPIDDVLLGLEGNDEVYALLGNDTLDGGSGNDYLDGGGGSDAIIGATGEDYLIGGSGNDSLVGGDDDDALFGGDHRDTLIGGEGGDVLHGGSGSDALDGGAGDDVYIFDASPTAVAGNRDTLQDSGGNDLIKLNGVVDSEQVFALQTNPGQLSLYFAGQRLDIQGVDAIARINVDIDGQVSTLSSFLEDLPPLPVDDVTLSPANLAFVQEAQQRAYKEIASMAGQGAFDTRTVQEQASIDLWETIVSNLSEVEAPTRDFQEIEEPEYAVVSTKFYDANGRYRESEFANGFVSLAALGGNSSFSGYGISSQGLSRIASSQQGAPVSVYSWSQVFNVSNTEPVLIGYDYNGEYVGGNVISEYEISGYVTRYVDFQSARASILTLGDESSDVDIYAGVVNAGDGDDDISASARWFSGQTVDAIGLLVQGGTSTFLDGGGGNDRIDGSALDDVLLGGSGADTLLGRAGRDHYLVLDYGQSSSDSDVISDINTTDNGEGADWAFDQGIDLPSDIDEDVVEFGPGIALENVLFARGSAWSQGLHRDPNQPYENEEDGEYSPGALVISTAGRKLASIDIGIDAIHGSGIEYLRFQGGQQITFEQALAQADLLGPPPTADDLPNAIAEQGELFIYNIAPETFSGGAAGGLVVSVSVQDIYYDEYEDDFDDAGDFEDSDSNGLPDWLSFDPSTGLLLGTPQSPSYAEYTFKATATDENFANASTTFTVVVNEEIPAIVSGELQNAYAEQSELFSYSIGAETFVNGTGYDLALSVTVVDIAYDIYDEGFDDAGDFSDLDENGLPDWLSFDTETGILSGTPQSAGFAEYIVTVTATSVFDDFAEVSFSIFVNDSEGEMNRQSPAEFEIGNHEMENATHFALAAVADDEVSIQTSGPSASGIQVQEISVTEAKGVDRANSSAGRSAVDVTRNMRNAPTLLSGDIEANEHSEDYETPENTSQAVEPTGSISRSASSEYLNTPAGNPVREQSFAYQSLAEQIEASRLRFEKGSGQVYRSDTKSNALDSIAQQMPSLSMLWNIQDAVFNLRSADGIDRQTVLSFGVDDALHDLGRADSLFGEVSASNVKIDQVSKFQKIQPFDLIQIR